MVDETGAGDCFRAAFTVALVEGKPLPECLRFAAAAGAVAVSREGAVPAIPSRQDLEDLLPLLQEAGEGDGTAAAAAATAVADAALVLAVLAKSMTRQQRRAAVARARSSPTLGVTPSDLWWCCS